MNCTDCCLDLWQSYLMQWSRVNTVGFHDMLVTMLVTSSLLCFEFII